MYRFFLAAMVCILPCFGQIIEIQKIEEVKEYVEDAFLFLNVGDTLFAPSSMLSDYQWREYFVQRAEAVVSDRAKANKMIDRVKAIIVEKIPKITPEPTTPQVVAELQMRNIPILGYTQRFFSTSYAPNNGEIVHHHLMKMGIELTKTLTNFPAIEYNTPQAAFCYGILFTNKNPVGPTIVDFFNKIAHFPHHVVIVDDSIETLQDIQAALSPNVITTLLRYRQMDAHKAAFDKNIATLQFFAFINQGEILSDEDAMQLKQNLNYEEMLDHWILQEVKEIE